MIIPKILRFIIPFCIFIIAENLFLNCKQKTNIAGQKLAKTYCSSCHLFPNPNLLPKNVWKHSTLPYMGILMGINSEVGNLPEPLKPYAVLKPENQIISNADWEKIKQYYIDESPEKLDTSNQPTLTELKGLFSVEKIDTKLANSTIPNFTNVSIDTLNRQIIAGDQSNRYIWFFDKNGKPSQIIKDQNALSNIQYFTKKPDQVLLTFMGKTTQANQEIKGYITINKLDVGLSEIQKIQNNLDRPVSCLVANFDKSIDDELVISEFGFKDGGISILKKGKNNNYIQKYLSHSPGVVKTIIIDFDSDNDLDIISLFAQGNERIIFFKNNGNLTFEEIQLLQLPPIYGSNYFDLADVNNDGKLDILYAAGDNDDFTTILKPYHGIYIYENQGKNSFAEKHFFAQNGACKLIPNDYDLDGDIDLISISLFPDVDKRPKEGFIYFENNNGKFDEKTLDINHLGRWAVVDAGDLDADGDVDLVLGSHPVAKFPAGFDQEWKLGSGLIILRNNSTKNL